MKTGASLEEVAKTGLSLRFALEKLPAPKLKEPVYLTFAPGLPEFVFVVEKPGRILRLKQTPGGGFEAAEVFLDIQDRVAGGKGSGERGLLGLAFAPDYESSGRLYVNYTKAPRGTPTRISRFLRDPKDPSRARPDSEEVVLEFRQPWANHNGGMVAFGPDGYLYVGTGDGGSGGDPLNAGQRRDTLLGKILRLDVSGPGPARPAPGNPFVGSTEKSAKGKPLRPEIYAWGLRNPWRFSFDRHTGQLWAGDVGQNAIEEVDLIEKGKNYGWKIQEASACFSPKTDCPKVGLEPPMAEYRRPVGHSITGGVVARSPRLRQLWGMYLYGDFVTGKVFALRRAPRKSRNPPKHRARKGYQVLELLDGDIQLSSFGEDTQGQIYLLDLRGSISRLKALP